MPIRALPTFRGYTVDYRLQQFRQIKPGKPYEFIEFADEEGAELLMAWLEAEPEEALEEINVALNGEDISSLRSSYMHL